MKKIVAGCFLIGLVLGSGKLSQGAGDPVFSSSSLTITAKERGLELTIKLPDGTIEKVVPPPGILRPGVGKDPEAEKKYEQSIKELETFLTVYPAMKLFLCELYLKIGSNQDAYACYTQAGDLFKSLNDIATQTLALNQAALFLWEVDQKDAAMQQAQRSFYVYRQHVRKLRQAEKQYNDALQQARDADDQERQLLVHQQLALVTYALGKDEESREHGEMVLKLFKKIDTPLMGKQRMDALIVKPIRELLDELQAAREEGQ